MYGKNTRVLWCFIVKEDWGWPACQPPQRLQNLACRYRSSLYRVHWGLHWPPYLTSLGDRKISLQIYIELTGFTQWLAPTPAPRCARCPICAPAPEFWRLSAPEISSKCAQLCSLDLICLPYVICRPCEGRLGNAIQLKHLIVQTQKSLKQVQNIASPSVEKPSSKVPCERQFVIGLKEKFWISWNMSYLFVGKFCSLCYGIYIKDRK